MWKAFKATAGVLLALVVLPLALLVGGCVFIGVGAKAARDARERVQKTAASHSPQESPDGVPSRVGLEP